MAYAWSMRRALYALTLVFAFVFVMLYWNQLRDIPGATLIPHKSSGRSQAVPYWTWVCVNNHCERRARKRGVGPNGGGTSFATCSMLCGSTQLWPQPTGPVTLASHALAFHVDQLELTNVKAPLEVKHLLKEAFEILKTNIRSMIQPKDSTNFSKQHSDFNKFLIDLNVQQPYVSLDLNTDENYTLSMRPQNHDILVTIDAETFFGARHGLETLSQLTFWDDESETLRVVKGASIQDKPKFSYRGLLVDTARNFFSIRSLKRVLDGMAASKLNTFHWHISDSQSFPFDAPSVPEMAKTGAYSPSQVYSANDIKDLVEYAKVRGIRIVIEIDTPAHAGMGWTWGPSKGLGQLALCVGQQPWSLYCGEPPCGQLNPHNPQVFKVLSKLYKDILDLTGERAVFHIGGDEVNLECWSQQRSAYTTALNYTDLHDLWGDFTLLALHTLEKVTGANKSPSIVIIWSSNLTKKPYLLKYLDRKKFVVQTWGASQWMETYDLLDSGYRIIISHVDAWYLDCGFGSWRGVGEGACDPYRTWQTVYAHRPWHHMRLTAEKRALVIGGEACLWTEQVDEETLDSRLWPRAAAFAERLWSDIPLQNDVQMQTLPEDTFTRLNTHRDRLVTRGIGAEMMWPRWCTQNPGMCL